MLYLTGVLAISIDCPDVINLAYGMNMHLVRPTQYNNLINYDCCDSNYNFGVTCINNRVTQLRWIRFDLNGTINATAIPTNVDTLIFRENQLTGSVPSLPSSVTFFKCTTNRLTGSLPAFSSSIQSFDVGENDLTGEIPALPQSMQNLHLYINRLNGSVPISPNLILLYSGSNLLTGTIPYQLYSLNALALYSNLLVGSIPSLPNSLLYLYLSGNQLSGRIPPMPLVNNIELYDNPLLKGFLNMTKAFRVLIQNTSISEFYHSEPIRLTNCNLNNTALLGKVDGYTQCARSNLFTLDNNSVSSTFIATSTASGTFDTSTASGTFDTSTASGTFDTSTASGTFIATFTASGTFIDTSTASNESNSPSTASNESSSPSTAFFESSKPSVVSEETSSNIYKGTTSSLTTSVSNISTSVPATPIRLTRRFTDQAKSISTQFDQQSMSSFISETLYQQTSITTTVLSYLEPKIADIQNIKFTFSLAIHFIVNWGLIIYIFTECKRSYSKRTRKSKISSDV